MVKSQLIKIDGIDVTSKRINSDIDDTVEDQADKAIVNFAITVDDVSGLTLETFKTIDIWESDGTGTLESAANKVFSGTVSKITREPTRITVEAYGDLWLAVQTEVNKTYDINIDVSAGKGSEIFKDLADIAGLSYDSATVVDTGSAILLKKFVCAKASVFERMKTLAEIYGYQIKFKPQTDKIYFQPIGYETNANTIYIGGTNNNVQQRTTWKEDATKLFNKIEIVGAYQEVQKTETFSGTGSQTTFTLTFAPEITDVYVSSVQQIGGVEGSTATFDYTVDKDQKQIIFQSGSIPGSGTDNISVTYSYRAPRPVVRSNSSSIDSLGRTIKQIFTFNDIQSIDDAETRASDLLAVYSQPFVTTTVTMTPAATLSLGLEAGQIIRVKDETFGFDRDMLVKRINMRYPTSDVIVEIGDKEARIGDIERDVTLRLKRLEEELAKAGTFIVEVIDINNTFNIKKRYMITEKRTADGTTLIWGSTSQGTWGSYNWGTEAFGSWSRVFVIQENNIYTENFIDTDFKSSNTTATWTGTGSVTFTASQKAESEAFDYNNGTITRAKLTSTEASGSFTYQMTADGTNWETVTSGTIHYFTNTGTDLRWRATENAASTGEITKIEVTNYH